METADLSHHILSRFNADLEGVRSAVLQMGGLVERQLQDGVRALVTGRIHSRVPAADPARGQPEQVHRQTVSLGVAELIPSMMEARHLLDAADRALYQAKRSGRNRLAI